VTTRHQSRGLSVDCQPTFGARLLNIFAAGAQITRLSTSIVGYKMIPINKMT